MTVSLLLLLALPAPATEAQPSVPVESATVFAGHHPLAPGDAIWLNHGGLVWTVSLSDAPPYVLEVGDHPHRTQEVHRFPVAPGEADLPVLRWAGDRDGDGVLDLVIELPGPEGRVPHVLLSGQARGEAHVAPITET